jgi:hypothetical protein
VLAARYRRMAETEDRPFAPCWPRFQLGEDRRRR